MTIHVGDTVYLRGGREDQPDRKHDANFTVPGRVVAIEKANRKRSAAIVTVSYLWRGKEEQGCFLMSDIRVKRRNLMSGKDFMEAADTPYYCSPSSETYWSS